MDYVFLSSDLQEDITILSPSARYVCLAGHLASRLQEERIYITTSPNFSN